MNQPRARFTLSLGVGSALIAFFVSVALLAPFFAPYAPDQILAGERLAPPSATHIFGTDSLGRDMFSRVLYGSRIALWTMLLGVGVAVAIGVVPGLVSGYAGGWVDQVLARVMEVGLAFPGLLLALIIVARLGPSLDNAIIALGIISAPGFYRVARNQTISVRRLQYVEAAQSLGASNARILFRHIAPNLLSTLVVVATMRAGLLLLAIGGLSFVGLGAQPPLPEWGALLASGRSYLETAPWLSIFPGLGITLLVVGANLFGDGLRDWLDPHRPGRELRSQKGG